MFGDAGTGDVVYTGDEGASAPVYTLDYYRNKVREFQTVLQAVDTAGAAAYEARGILMSQAELSDDDQATLDQLNALVDEFENKRGELRTTAEAINLGANGINWAGGSFPVLSIPTGLGMGPLVIGAGLIAAIAVAGALITWGVAWIRAVRDVVTHATSLYAVRNDPDATARLVMAQQQATQALQQAESSPVFSFTNLIKWGAIGALVVIGLHALQAARHD